MKKFYPYLNLILNLSLFITAGFVLANIFSLSLYLLLIVAIILPVVWFFITKGEKRKEKYWQNAMHMLYFFSISLALFFVFDVISNIITMDVIKINLHTHLSLVLILIAILLNFVLIKIFSNSQKSQKNLDDFLNGPPLLFSLSVAIVLSALLLSLLQTLTLPDFLAFLQNKLLKRGLIPPLCLVLFNWGILLLLGKVIFFFQATKIPLQINKTKADSVIDIIWLQNNNFYQTLRYINWAIPLLGFIGTVLGISLASEGLQKIISQQSGFSALGGELASAIAPLGIAFDTTLVALSLSVVLALLQTMLQKKEEHYFCILQKEFFK
jgi:hypothetical protein